MQVRLINQSEVDHMVHTIKDAHKVRRELKKIFLRAEILRNKLMWLENPHHITISWDQLRKELGI